MKVDAVILPRQKRESERHSVRMSGSSAVATVKLGALKKLAQALLLEVSSLEQQKGDTEWNSLDLSEEVLEFEASLIRCALVKTNGHQARAARLLNIKPTTLCEKMKRYGIAELRDRPAADRRRRRLDDLRKQESG